MSQLFLPLTAPFAVREAWAGVAQRLGVPVVHTAQQATHSLAWNNASAAALTALPHVAFMPASTLAIITDRVLIGQHLPAMPATARLEELDAMPGLVYLKPSNNDQKRYAGGDTLSHSVWSTSAEVPAEARTAMQAGTLVATPFLGSPHSNLEIDFAVSVDGELRVMHCFNHGFQGCTSPLRMTLGAAEPADLLAAVQRFCLTHGVRGGIHNIQAVWYEDLWRVMDWNPRPSGMYPGFAHLHPGIADHGLAHMLGIKHAAAPVYIELRPYWDRQISNDRASAIRALGLHPRWVYDRNRIARVAGVADTKAEVTAMFDAFEATL